jgi:hypothetical protein
LQIRNYTKGIIEIHIAEAQCQWVSFRIVLTARIEHDVGPGLFPKFVKDFTYPLLVGGHVHERSGDLEPYHFVGKIVRSSGSCPGNGLSATITTDNPAERGLVGLTNETLEEVRIGVKSRGSAQPGDEPE